MAANINKWSLTAASNDTADPAINWAEGQAPSTVNNSNRAMMQGTAADRDDTRGALTFGGTSSSLTLTTNSGNVTYQNGLRVSGKLASAFAANATLNVDSVGAKNIYRYNNAGAAQVQVADGFTGQHVTFEYEAALNSSAGGWVLLGEPVGRVVGIQLITSSGTYTRNPAASTGDIYLVGGGGGGGGVAVTSSTTAALAGAGASGSASILYNAALPATATVTIGAAGTAGTSAPGNGGTGGTSSFVGGSINMTAPGGVGGNVNTAFTTASNAAAQILSGNPGSVGTGGTVNMFGISSPPSTWTIGFSALSAAFGSFSPLSNMLGTFGAGGNGKVTTNTTAQAGNAGFAGAVLIVERA